MSSKDACQHGAPELRAEMPRKDYGWTICSQRGGPGGCPFDDCQHLERATGGCADEWVLCEVEFSGGQRHHGAVPAEGRNWCRLAAE